jgi:hypothetical protein
VIQTSRRRRPGLHRISLKTCKSGPACRTGDHRRSQNIGKEKNAHEVYMTAVQCAGNSREFMSLAQLQLGSTMPTMLNERQWTLLIPLFLEDEIKEEIGYLEFDWWNALDGYLLNDICIMDHQQEVQITYSKNI